MSSARWAYLLFRAPVMVAVHADEMLGAGPHHGGFQRSSRRELVAARAAAARSRRAAAQAAAAEQAIADSRRALGAPWPPLKPRC